MNVVYFGSGQFGVNCLDAIAQSKHKIAMVVTQPVKAAGRGKKPKPTPVAAWAASKSVPAIETDNVNDKAIIRRIANAAPDLIVVIAFGQKVSRELTELPPHGAINVHASLLPKYRGAAPINWAIINGETETGISIITLAEKMDAGRIIAEAKTSIGPDETAGELHDRLAQLSAPLLTETIDKIAEGAAVYKDQDHSQATLAPKLSKSDGWVDFSQDAEIAQRRIRGLWPWPGASAGYISQKDGSTTRVTIAGAQVVETPNPQQLAPGTLDENLNVICASNALRITRVKPEGSRLMDFKSFANGRNTSPGDTFMRIDG